MLLLQTEEVLSPRVDVTMPPAGYCVAVGLKDGCLGVGTPSLLYLGWSLP